MENFLHYLTFLDIIILIAFFVFLILFTYYFSKKTTNELNNFFLSGRKLPWYIAGTAMVATTFAADTPLAVTELVAYNGIAGNWLWWNMAIGGMLTVFFFAPLWRRSEILTDLEFIELRYSGKSATILRGFKAIYLGFLMNIIILAWVHKAMDKIFLVIFPGVNSFILVIVFAFLTAIYAMLIGLSGTVRTDSIQFVLALTGCIILAIYAVKIPEIGGLKGLKEKVDPSLIKFFPEIGINKNSVLKNVFALPIGAFVAYVFIQWWAAWYPGADPGGGGYIAQRIMATKNEKHGLLATLWFNIAHYTLRPWPWIIVALCAIIILPRTQNLEELRNKNPYLYEKVVKAYNEGENIYSNSRNYTKEFIEMYECYQNSIDPGVMYPKLMVKYLPKGLIGLLLAVFLSAYMSTIASQLNWGTSYIVNDFYKRFLIKDKTDKYYVMISRLIFLVLTLLSLIVAKYFLNTIKGAWEFIINASAGLGFVLILRWYWWRINAWSEITAMIIPIFVYLFLIKYTNYVPPYTMYFTTLSTIIITLLVTYITPPVELKKLTEFYRKVHPFEYGWHRIHANIPDVKPDDNFKLSLINWICGIIVIYSSLYAIGKFLFGFYKDALLAIIVLIIFLFLLLRNLDRMIKN